MYLGLAVCTYVWEVGKLYWTSGTLDQLFELFSLPNVQIGNKPKYKLESSTTLVLTFYSCDKLPSGLTMGDRCRMIAVYQLCEWTWVLFMLISLCFLYDFKLTPWTNVLCSQLFVFVVILFYRIPLTTAGTCFQPSDQILTSKGHLLLPWKRAKPLREHILVSQEHLLFINFTT